VLLVDGVRSAFARGGRGKLAATRLDEAGAQLLCALLERNPGLRANDVEDVGLGNASGEGEFLGLGHVARLAGLPFEVSSFNSNRQCGSSMETFHRIAASIAIGASECGVALGIERVGLPPVGGGRRREQTRVSRLNPRLFQPTELQRSMAADHTALFSVPFPDHILSSPPLQGMPQTAQNAAECYALSRLELDVFAVASHQKAAAAYARGVYRDEIVPLEIELPVFDDTGAWLEDERGPRECFEVDEHVRGDTDLDHLGILTPVKGLVSFGEKELVITTGNGCPLADGLAAALLVSEDLARERGLVPLARVRGLGVAGVKPQMMGLGTVPAARRALRNAGLAAEQMERVEIHEAFAAQVIPSLRELRLAPDRTNVSGGSIALGHPLGATGARLVGTLGHELRRSGARYGIAMQSIGAGMGMATVLERID
jgi:acetyl-CoA acetyltransferase family protein